MQDDFSFLNNVRENDLPSMIEWYRNASAAGDVLSKDYLGMCYEHGRGVEKSIKEACLLYSRAAEGGNADAMYAIGRLIESGKVSRTRDGDALIWYKRAAALGHKDAIAKVKSDISEIVKNLDTSEADPDVDLYSWRYGMLLMGLAEAGRLDYVKKYVDRLIDLGDEYEPCDCGLTGYAIIGLYEETGDEKYLQ